MELRIETESWGLCTKDDKQKTISGKYVIKCGKEVVASKCFNDGYGAANITIPASILVKAEEIDSEIRQAIVDNFRQKQSPLPIQIVSSGKGQTVPPETT